MIDQRFLLVALSTAGLLCACHAQDTRTITVDVIGTASAEPDQFVVRSLFHARSSTYEGAAREAEAFFQEYSEQIPALAGLEGYHLTTAGLEIRPNCEGERNLYGNMPRDCELVDYSVRQFFTVKGSPPHIAGDAVSLGMQLGAAESSIESYEISDSAFLEAAATANAVERARVEAGLIASSMGAELGPVRAVAPEPNFFGRPQLSEIGLNAALPESHAREVEVDVRLSTRPEPISFTVRLAFQFELLDAEGIDE